MVIETCVIDRNYRTLNIQRFDDNRKRLRDLIYKMRTFTSDELYNEFSKGGDTIIDTEQTFDDYLKQLVFSGLLRYEFGRYEVQ